MARTVTERLADLEPQHRDKVEGLKAEVALGALCPIEPYMVHFASKPEPWITYKAKTIADALVILDAFPVVAGFAVDDGCVYVGPNKRERGTLRFEAPELFVVRLDHIGRSHRTQGLEWWTPLGEKIARVKVEVEQWPWKSLPSCEVHYDRNGFVTTAKHALQDLGEWKRIKWGAGSPDSCTFALYFDSKERGRSWLVEIAS